MLQISAPDGYTPAPLWGTGMPVGSVYRASTLLWPDMPAPAPTSFPVHAGASLEKGDHVVQTGQLLGRATSLYFPACFALSLSHMSGV